ncbi:hypothetical protein [Acetoanaerobium sticklandii]|uniref:hypothetical protein n=1 Tax=Acetoanaerobium sticklandii TaxID=1511 RepID=UPI003A8DA38C
MKRIYVLLLSLILLISLATTSFASIADSENQLDLNSSDAIVYVENLSSENNIAENQFISASKYNSVKVKIANVDIHSSLMNLSGEVSIKGNMKKIPFILEGELKKIDTSNDIIVGELVDKSDNFEVIHFSINNNSDKFLSASGNKYNYETINIYLQFKGTRDFIFAELKLPNNLANTNLFERTESLKLFNAADLFWYAKIINPSKVNTNNQDNASDLASTRGASIQSKIDQDYHTFTYNWVGEQYTEYVYVNNILEYPGDASDFRATAIIKKYYSWTKNDRTGSIVSYNTTAEVSNLKIEMSFTNGARIDYLFVGGRHSSGSTFKASIGVSFSTAIPGVGISLNYQPLTTTTIYPVHINAPSLSAARANGEFLLSNDDHMLVRSEYSGSGMVYAKYTYTIGTPFSSNGSVTITTQLNAEAL